MNCTLCPRECGIDRSVKPGFCGMTDELRIGRAALHIWEEPCISGNDGRDRVPGSGAVFFSGCSLKCVYCQNAQISAQRAGKTVTEDRLADIFLELEQQGAWNINLVTAAHFVPQVIRALEIARRQGLRIPAVYNSGGYESVSTLQMLKGYIDIYMPDMKYDDPAVSAALSGAPDYPDVVRAALAEMVRQTGDPVMVPDGGGERMLRGVLVRHLLLPGQLMAAKRIVRYLYETYQDHIYLSLMNQYTPMPWIDAARLPELTQPVSARSYKKLVDYAIGLGVTKAYIQDGVTAKESFIPVFDGTGA